MYATKKRNITIDDVRGVINNEENNIDVFETNASKIRGVLGRGSLATIQKFLNIIRDERKKEGIENNGEIDRPKPDINAIETIWNVVLDKVHTITLEHLNELNVSRDSLRDSLQTLSNDNQSLVSEIERLETIIDEKDNIIIETAKAMEERERAYEDEILSLKSALAEAHSNNEKQKMMFEQFMANKL